MPQEQSSDAMRADAEALDWVVELQEYPDDVAVRRRFEAWRRASPLHAAAWRETTRVYAGIGDLPPAHADRWRWLAARRDRSGPAAANQGHRAHRRWAPITLAGAAAAVAMLVIAPELTLRWQADALTGTAQVREVALGDGSVASLAPDSAIKIAYSPTERRVTLLRGRVWFDVHHDAARPFQVVARNVQATDIGTAFEVRLGSDDTRVAVGRGIVRVDDTAVAPTVSERLTAGESVTINTAGIAARGQEASDLIGSWRDGRLAVEGRPMREVIDALRPWYGGVIAVTPGAPTDRPVTGVYDLRDPAGALTALAKAYGAHVTRITPWLLVLSSG